MSVDKIMEQKPNIFALATNNTAYNDRPTNIPQSINEAKEKSNVLTHISRAKQHDDKPQ